MDFDISAIGEALVDVLVDEDDERLVMTGNAGGAVINALVAGRKYGASTAFIGKLSEDRAGRFLMKTLCDCGVNTDAVVIDNYPTTFAVVSLDGNGERSFSFYRNKTSDVMLAAREIKTEIIDRSIIFHFGSVSLTDEPARSATLFAAEYARKAGRLVSFDPNLRPRLWGSLTEAKDIIERAIYLADIVKLSDDEFTFLTDQPYSDTAAADYCSRRGIRLLAVTCAEKGAVVIFRGNIYKCVPPEVNVKDTTGAGDAFLGAFLSQIVNDGQICLNESAVAGALRFAVCTATLSTTKYGAIPSYVEVDEVLGKLSECSCTFY